jgi:hypothetical protein
MIPVDRRRAAVLLSGVTKVLEILCRNCQLHVHLDSAGFRLSARSPLGVLALLIVLGVIVLARPW